MPNYIKLPLWIIVYLGVGFAIGQVTQGSIDGWYQEINKPSFNPPNWIFPIMWSFLYVLIAITGWNLWREKGSKDLKIIYIFYTILNWLWTPIFFGLHQIEAGLVWIILINIVNFVFLIRAWNKSRICAILMIPVFLWTMFAMVLCYKIWELNV